MRRPVAALLALTMLAAACGDSDGDGALPSAFGGSGGDSDSAVPSAFGGSGGSWCDIALDLEDSDPFGDFGSDALPTTEQLRAAFERIREVLAVARSAAPAEIRDDVEEVADAFVDGVAAFEEADYDIFAMDATDERLIRMDSDELAAAGDRIEEYNRVQCGISTDSDPADDDSGDESGFEELDDFPLPDDIGDQLVDGLVAAGFSRDEAECLLDELGPNMTGLAGTGPLDAFGNCGIDASRMAELGG